MAKQVQLRKGTTSDHTTFTGAEGEISIDTTKKTAVVHDGTTAGGNPLLRASGGELGINESVYLGIPGEIKRCEQITISAQMASGDDGAETTVKWALSRISDK